MIHFPGIPLQLFSELLSLDEPMDSPSIAARLKSSEGNSQRNSEVPQLFAFVIRFADSWLTF